MPDERGDPAEPTGEPAAPEQQTVAAQGPATDVVVVRAGEPPAVVWRRRVMAVRARLPELARDPVVLGASAAAATIAARIALDVVRHLAGAPAPRPTSSTARSVHHVHVTHHVVHHTGGPVVLPVVLRALPEDRGR